MSPHTQVLEDLADQVAQKGIKVIDGAPTGDDTFYSPQRYPEGWAQDDLQWLDGAPISALTFNDNVLFLKILPGAQAGEKAVITIDPPGRLLRIRQPYCDHRSRAEQDWHSS